MTPTFLPCPRRCVDDRLHVVGDGAEADHDGLGVVAHEGLDRAIFAPGQLREFCHHLARETRHLADEVGAVVDRARLEIRLILDAAGEAGIVHVDQRRNALARPLLVGVDPLPAPLAVQFVGNPRERALDQRAFAVVFDGVGRFGEEGLES